MPFAIIKIVLQLFFKHTPHTHTMYAHIQAREEEKRTLGTRHVNVKYNTLFMLIYLWLQWISVLQTSYLHLECIVKQTPIRLCVLHRKNWKCEMHEVRMLNMILHLRLNLPMHSMVNLMCYAFRNVICQKEKIAKKYDNN